MMNEIDEKADDLELDIQFQRFHFNREGGAGREFENAGNRRRRVSNKKNYN